MRVYTTRLCLLLCVYVLGTTVHSNAQDTAAYNSIPKTQQWFIVLPLRFTHLQNHNTMLSGIKAGRKMNSGFSVAISVYHSFYLNSFKSKANLSGFKQQPQLFINGVGLELQYDLYTRKAFTINMQLLTGWGFLKYDLKDQEFKSKQVNYLALEPSVNAEFSVGRSTVIGLGAGYRPILGRNAIHYTSAISNGEIPVNKMFPNGLNLLLNLKGYL